MVKLFDVAFCVAAATFVSGAPEYDASEYDPIARAWDGVCWYETLKVFPNTKSEIFGKCRTQVQKKRAWILSNGGGTPEGFAVSFGPNMKSGLKYLGQAYKQTCEALLQNADAAPQSDESAVLEDDSSMYPFKAFAHCLISTLRQQHGDQAVNDVLHEKFRGEKDWRHALLERENQFRQRHDVPPLVIHEDLNRDADAYAKVEAERCHQNHSTEESRKWNGGMQGENLAQLGGADDKLETAYAAIDGWYEEMKDYPYASGGYKDNDDKDDVLFHKIGHFTQTVWKGSQQVGYGYAYNPKCSGTKSYNVARYFPAGNRVGKWSENVMPLKA